MLLKLDSSNRYTGSVHDFRLKFADSIQGQFQLKSAYMPNSAYNVNSTNNLIYLYQSANFTATITPGYYSSNSFATAIQTALNAVSSGYSVTYSSITGFITITNVAAFHFRFATNTINSAASLMGFSGDGIDATSQTGWVNLSGYRSYNIQIEDCQSVMNTVTGHSWSMVIPLTVNTGDIAIYEPQYGSPFTIRSTKQIRVQVLDDLGNSIPLRSDFYLLLEQLGS